MRYMFAIHMQESQIEAEMPWDCVLGTVQKQLREKNDWTAYLDDADEE